MDITPLPPSEILLRHSHTALLPSPFPNISLSGWSGGGIRRTSHKQSYSLPLPKKGTSPISGLPAEILLNICSHLDLRDLLPLRQVCRQWDTLVLDPSLHSSFHLAHVPERYPPVIRKRLIQLIRRLHVNLFPCPSGRSAAVVASLLRLLDAIPRNRLETLSLPYTSPYFKEEQLETYLAQLGGTLRHLDLKGSSLTGERWIEWFSQVGSHGEGLETLNLGFTIITSLPMPSFISPDPFRNLKSLSLASCSHLSTDTIASFLKKLPITLEELDLSRVDSATFEALWNTRVVRRNEWDDMCEDAMPTALRQVRVVGVDHLTRHDIRQLKQHWEEQRKACFPPSSVASPVSVVPTRWTSHCSFPLTPPASPDRSVPIRKAVDIVSGLPTPPSSVSPPPYAPQMHSVHPTAFNDDAVAVTILHSAILETEDEAGYRQFIGEIVNGTVPPRTFGYRPPEGLGLGFGRDIASLTFGPDIGEEWW